MRQVHNSCRRPVCHAWGCSHHLCVMCVLSELMLFLWAFQAGGGQLVSAMGAVISPLETMAQLGWLAVKEVDGGGAEKRRMVGRKEGLVRLSTSPMIGSCQISATADHWLLNGVMWQVISFFLNSPSHRALTSSPFPLTTAWCYVYEW